MKVKISVRFSVFLVIVSLLAFSAQANVSAQSGGDLIINYVDVSPAQGRIAYDVEVTFTLLDANGNPIRDLTAEDLTLSEDGRQVALASLDLVTNEPISVFLLIDSSGSMASKMPAAREAATAFMQGLNTSDEILIADFNDELTPRSEFSIDRVAAGNAIKSIESVYLGGTCLYDAMYEAVQKTAARPIGRRAVVVLTDGKDEKYGGGACSSYTTDDVISLAAADNLNVPIFTIGLGSTVDAGTLTRVANLTGGKYSYAADSSELQALFDLLLEQLQSQYVARYTSTSAPGSHTLVVKAASGSVSDESTASVLFPELPLTLTITSPVEGQAINKKITISTAYAGQGLPIARVVFQANDDEIGRDESTPYELEWDARGFPDGELTLTAIALAEDGTELSRASVTVNIAFAPPSTQPGGAAQPPKGGFFNLKNMLLIGSALLLVIVAIILFVIFNGKKKKKNQQQRDKEWDAIVNPTGYTGSAGDDHTMDELVPGASSLGLLVVLQSDDPGMLQQRFELNGQSTRLGRAADNDILFPKDRAVSRHHAIIEDRNGQLVISEMVSPDADGSLKAPTYNSYVNEQKVTGTVPLYNGDKIRLGTRLTLQLITSRGPSEDDAKTIDQLEPPDLDKTTDS